MIVIRIVLAAWLVSGCSSTNDADSRRQQCAQMRDHLIDLRLADVGQDHTSAGAPTMPPQHAGPDAPPEPAPPPQPVDPAQLAQHRAAMKQALGDRFIDDCLSQMTNEQLSCALAAKNQDAVNACSTKTASN